MSLVVLLGWATLGFLNGVLWGAVLELLTRFAKVAYYALVGGSAGILLFLVYTSGLEATASEVVTEPLVYWIGFAPGVMVGMGIAWVVYAIVTGDV